MMDEAKVFGEVSRRVRRFKLDISTPKPSTAREDSISAAAAATNAVYSHIGGIGHIPQLRGLKCARRRGRFRLIRRNGSSAEADLVKEYAKAISILTPMFVEETQKKLVNTVSDIVSKGKEPQNKYAAEINKQKNRPTYLQAKRRRLEEDQEQPEEETKEVPKEEPKEKTKGKSKGKPKGKSKEDPKEEQKEEPKAEHKGKLKGKSKGKSKGKPKEETKEEPKEEAKEEPKEEEEEDITELTEEERETKRLREEVLAAIAALTAGIEQEEMIKSICEFAKSK